MIYKNWTDIIKPKRLEVDSETHNRFYGKFACEPLERGFGTTLGNALRRVLLSSLRGSAITAVRIKDVYHEFSAIPGVLEDVTEILLNLKQVRLKVLSEGVRMLHLEASKPGELKAKDIQTDGMVEILNPEHHIATCGKEADLEMEMVVSMGKGYVAAERNRDERAPVGTVPVDALFSPIQRVNFTVSNARVENVTDYDKLVMEIETNGAISPEEAIRASAKILVEQLAVFAQLEGSEIAAFDQPAGAGLEGARRQDHRHRGPGRRPHHGPV